MFSLSRSLTHSRYEIYNKINRLCYILHKHCRRPRGNYKIFFSNVAFFFASLLSISQFASHLLLHSFSLSLSHKIIYIERVYECHMFEYAKTASERESIKVKPSSLQILYSM